MEIITNFKSNDKIVTAADEVFGESNLTEESIFSKNMKQEWGLIVEDLKKQLSIELPKKANNINKNYNLENILKITVSGSGDKKKCHIKFSDGSILSGHFVNDKFEGPVYLESTKEDWNLGVMLKDSILHKDYIQ